MAGCRMMPDKQNKDLKELMSLAFAGGFSDMHWQLMTDEALAVHKHILGLEAQVKELTEFQMEEIEPHVWPNMDDDPDRLDIEVIGENGRFLLWFDEEGDAGYTVTTKSPVAYYGYMTPESLDALRARLNRGNLDQPARDKEGKK